MLVGHIHNFEKQLLRCCWSADGRQVAAGSADRMVNIWDVGAGRLQVGRVYLWVNGDGEGWGGGRRVCTYELNCVRL